MWMEGSSSGMGNYQQKEAEVEASFPQTWYYDQCAEESIMRQPPLPQTPATLCFSDMKHARDAERYGKPSSSPIETVTCEVAEHDEDRDLDLLNEAYFSVKGYIPLRDIDEPKIFKQKTPLGSTLLHIVTAYESDEWVRLVLERAPDLLTVKNSHGDMALHVAARVGHMTILEVLLTAHLRNETTLSFDRNPLEALDKILTQNMQGNTFIHEALLGGHKDVVMNLLSSEDNVLLPEVHKMVAVAAVFWTNKQYKSILYMAIEAGYKDVVELVLTKLSSTLLDNLIKIIPHNPHVPAGKSPLLAAIMKKDREILLLILTKIPAWIHLRDVGGRTPLHYAASIGYLDGVQDILNKCASCATERDKNGFSPIHCASRGGHVEVVEELIKKLCCVDPGEILDRNGRSFLHIAVESGKLNVVRHILKSADNELVEMINQQDADGNTPLHLATLSCHPKIVHALTWNKKVKLALVNSKNQTALDICMQRSVTSLPFRQRLTWAALKSAGVPYGPPTCSIEAPFQKEENLWEEDAPKMDQYKDRITTLILVSTLIVTVTFAAGFTLPGGLKSSDPGQGRAFMLHRMWFKLFIICITISMYGAISVTIILIWAQLGDLTMAIFAINVARYFLGVALTTLSVAFLAGVHLVISDLSWLDAIVLVLGVLFILTLLLLYTLLWGVPSTSTCPIVRLLSYYPFLMLASLVEAKGRTLLVAKHKET